MSPSLPTAPNWDENHLGALVPALMRPPEERRDWLPAPARSAERVVLVLLDGLGADAIDTFALPTLGEMAGGSFSTVCPATTAAALTSLTTGTLPGRHGTTGFRVRVRSDVLNVLRWRTQNGSEVVPHRFQPLTPFRGESVPVVAPREYANTSFTEAHLRGVTYRPSLSRTNAIELAVADIEAGAPFVYLYDAIVDQVAHRYGLRGRMYEAEVRSADRFVEELVQRLPSDTAVLVTADHGQIHVEDWIDLPDSVQSEVAVAAGDARFRSLYAFPGRVAILEARAREALSDRVWVMTRSELCNSGWLGPVNAVAAERLGDVILVPHGPVGIFDPSCPGERALRSAHGGFDPREMTVPLRSSFGRAGAP